MPLSESNPGTFGLHGDVLSAEPKQLVFFLSLCTVSVLGCELTPWPMTLASTSLLCFGPELGAPYLAQNETPHGPATSVSSCHLAPYSQACHFSFLTLSLTNSSFKISFSSITPSPGQGPTPGLPHCRLISSHQDRQ